MYKLWKKNDENKNDNYGTLHVENRKLGTPGLYINTRHPFPSFAIDNSKPASSKINYGGVSRP